MQAGDTTEAGSQRRGPSLCGAPAFEAVLATRPRARSAHFVLHHRPHGAVSTDLSTGPTPVPAQPVDESRLGLIIPKKQARRAVTRNLIRRQARACFDAALVTLPVGDWVLRLRSGFDRKFFPSASSEALRLAVRSELQGLLHQAAGRR